MNIQCTQKMLDKLKLPAQTMTEANDFFDWHAGLVLIERHNTAIFMNNHFRYSLILSNLKAGDFKKLDQLFRQALVEALQAEGIEQALIDSYLNEIGSVHFSRTSNRSIVSQLNYTGQILHYYSDVFINDQIIQTNLAVKFGKVAQKINGRYMDPRDLMLSAFAQYKELGSGSFLSDAPPKSVKKAQKAFVLTVQLPCEGMVIWRKIVVPAEITFARFHRILQACFNWQNAHLHLFHVMTEKGDVVAESKFDDLYGVDWEHKSFRDYFSERKYLTAYLPDYSTIHYTYDFGDDWLHLVELEETIEDYKGQLPQCLDGAGTAPPEDAGGEGGYLEFLNIVKQTGESDEKQEMLEWAKFQGWQPFDLKMINQKLMRIK